MTVTSIRLTSKNLMGAKPINEYSLYPLLSLFLIIFSILLSVYGAQIISTSCNSPCFLGSSLILPLIFRIANIVASIRMDSNSFLSIRTSANSGSILADTFNPTTPLMIEHLAMIFSNNLDRNTMSIARNGVGNDFSRSEFVDPLERYLLNSNSCRSLRSSKPPENSGSNFITVSFLSFMDSTRTIRESFFMKSCLDSKTRFKEKNTSC
mmetsp:Transcript_8385/g.11521  ORF Transcript_8385/g.11521 Transcript_8385/m.11521 type:complete len:209 (-) Transcript_8385:585-1211(-)